MSEINQIKVGDTTYGIEDTVAREALDQIQNNSIYILPIDSQFYSNEYITDNLNNQLFTNGSTATIMLTNGNFLETAPFTTSNINESLKTAYINNGKAYIQLNATIDGALIIGKYPLTLYYLTATDGIIATGLSQIYYMEHWITYQFQLISTPEDFTLVCQAMLG